MWTLERYNATNWQSSSIIIEPLSIGLFVAKEEQYDSFVKFIYITKRIIEVPTRTKILVILNVYLNWKMMLYKGGFCKEIFYPNIKNTTKKHKLIFLSF